MPLIDTHSHVIAYWDDGSPNWEISLDMLRDAESDGIEQIVCTPHILSRQEMEQDKADEVWGLYEDLVQRAAKAGIAVNIFMGAELYAAPDLKLDHKIATLAQNGKYFLVEFPMASIPVFAPQLFFNFVIDGKTPILAHPERNSGFLEDPHKAYDYVERGAFFQVTAGSLLGRFGATVQNLAIQLMDANLVHLVASDAHNLTSRPLKLAEAYKFVEEKWGKPRADKLFYENPLQVIAGETISIGEPKEIDLQPAQNWQNKVKSFFGMKTR
ncbi:MAG TPA: hypothetical protein PLP19_05530 [bacterium]|nr:hypothetical protein [bacterium]HPN42927.1 hypothetical protein [bacterium]